MSRQTLTPRLRTVFTFINNYVSLHAGVGPTYAEIATALGVKSRGTVKGLLDQLEDRGWIRRRPRRHRSLEIISDEIGERDGRHGS